MKCEDIPASPCPPCEPGPMTPYMKLDYIKSRLYDERRHAINSVKPRHFIKAIEDRLFEVEEQMREIKDRFIKQSK